MEPETPSREDSFLPLLRQTWRGSWGLMARRWPAFLGLLTLAASLTWIAFRWCDAPWIETVRASGKTDSAGRAVAEFIGGTGDHLEFNLAIFALLWIGGRGVRRRTWRRAALAGLLAMALAGLTSNVIRGATGRPRPSTRIKLKVEDGTEFGRGFRDGHAYSSFPSAHAATAFGTATAAAIACPPVGLPALAYAGTMAWARTAQRAHHPSDVVAGSMLGIFFGLAAGAWARNREG